MIDPTSALAAAVLLLPTFSAAAPPEESGLNQPPVVVVIAGGSCDVVPQPAVHRPDCSDGRAHDATLLREIQEQVSLDLSTLPPADEQTPGPPDPAAWIAATPCVEPFVEEYLSPAADLESSRFDAASMAPLVLVVPPELADGQRLLVRTDWPGRLLWRLDSPERQPNSSAGAESTNGMSASTAPETTDESSLERGEFVPLGQVYYIDDWSAERDSIEGRLYVQRITDGTINVAMAKVVDSGTCGCEWGLWCYGWGCGPCCNPCNLCDLILCLTPARKFGIC